ncbi:MAG: ATP-binding cassette domain-containing protein [Fimbriimonadaceae bacterium]|nr:ATP-binding cassette domain-containing protein [Chitinophagales bacterium]
MQIHLQHIIPQPLAEKDLSVSDIWNKEITFKAGEHIHVHAPSGIGKSTLIHILYGLRKDYEGALSFNNKRIKIRASYISNMRKKNISVVFQDMRLFPSLTGLENLTVKNSLTNFTSDDVIKNMMQQLGVEHLLQKTANTMSLGEQQRIAIIRSLLQPFNWLLLDEPFSHLDNNNIEKAKALIIQTCKKNNAGMCITTLGETYDMFFHKSLNL